MAVQKTLDAANGLGTTYAFDATNLFYGELSSNYDEDWIRAALEANYGYVVRLTGDGSQPASQTPILYCGAPTGTSFPTTITAAAPLRLRPPQRPLQVPTMRRLGMTTASTMAKRAATMWSLFAKSLLELGRAKA